MIQENQNDGLDEDHHAFSVGRKGIMLCVMEQKQCDVSNVVYDSGYILRTFKIKGVHVEADNAATADDRQDLRQFHHHGPEHDQIAHDFAKHVGKELQSIHREEIDERILHPCLQNKCLCFVTLE